MKGVSPLSLICAALIVNLFQDVIAKPQGFRQIHAGDYSDQPPAPSSSSSSSSSSSLSSSTSPTTSSSSIYISQSLVLDTNTEVGNSDSGASSLATGPSAIGGSVIENENHPAAQSLTSQPSLSASASGSQPAQDSALIDQGSVSSEGATDVSNAASNSAPPSSDDPPVLPPDYHLPGATKFPPMNRPSNASGTFPFGRPTGGVVPPLISHPPNMPSLSEAFPTLGGKNDSSFPQMTNILAGYHPGIGGVLTGDELSWARNPECTASWSSKVAANNGTVLDVRPQSITVTVTDKKTTEYRPGVTIIGPTTTVIDAGTVTNSIGSGKMCCGDCFVRYPSVSVFYWETEATNTWCLPYISGKTSTAEGTGWVGGDPASKPIKMNLNTNMPTLGPKADSNVQIAGVPGPGRRKAKRYEQHFLEEPARPSLSRRFDNDLRPGNEQKFAAHPRLATQEQDPLSSITEAPMLPTPKAVHHRPPKHHMVHPRQFVGMNMNASSPIMPQNGTSDETNILNDKPTVNHALGDDGFKFISPSVYVVFHTVLASDKCGLRGREYTSMTFAYDENELSSVDGITGETKVFNFADLPCPPSSWMVPNMLQGNTHMLAGFAETYRPAILGPESSLKGLDSAWSSCTIWNIGNGYDPPRALSVQGTMAAQTADPMPGLLNSGPAIAGPDEKPKPAGNPLLAPLTPAQNQPAETLAPEPEDPALQQQVQPLNVIRPPDTKTRPEDPALVAPVNNAPANNRPADNSPANDPAVNDPATNSPATNNPPANNLPANNPSANNPTIDQTPANDLPTKANNPPANPVLAPADNPPANNAPNNAPANNPPAINPIANNPPVNNAPANSPVNPPANAQPVQKQAVPQPQAVPQAAAVKTTDAPVVYGGQTITPDAAPVNIAGQSVAVADGSIRVGNSAAPVPQQQVAKSAPVVAGGVTLTPAPVPVANAAPAPPVTVGGLTFSAEQQRTPAQPAPAQPQNGVVNGQTAQNQPQAQPTPVTAGGLTFNPVDTGSPQPVGQPQAQIPGQHSTTINGQTYTPVAQNPAKPANPAVPAVAANPGNPAAQPVNIDNWKDQVAVPAGVPVVQNGVTYAPVVAGNPAPSPLGVVGGQTIVGNAGEAVVAGQTIRPGGTPVDIAGTPVSLGASDLVIGQNTVPLPPAAPPAASTALGTVGGQVISGDAASAIIGGQTVRAGGSPVNVAGTPVSLGNGNLVVGTNTVPVPAAGAQGPESLANVGGQVISGNAGSAVVAGQTIRAGELPVNIAGTPVSLGNDNIVVGTNTALVPAAGLGGLTPAGQSAFAINGQTVSNGGPLITVSGTRGSLGPSGLIVGSSTVPLTNPASLPSSAPRVFSVDGTGITEGGPPVTVSGTRISLGPSGVIVGSKTVALPSSSVLSVGDKTFTPNPTGFIVDGTTVSPGGPAATISGTPISLASNSELLIGSSTIALPTTLASPPTISVAGKVFTALPGSSGGLEISGQTLKPGEAQRTIAGTTYSVNTAGSLVVNGTSTYPLATGKGDGLLTAKGEVFKPLGSTAVEIDGKTLSLGGEAITDSSGTRLSLGTDGLVIGSKTVAYATPAETSATSTNGPVEGQNSVFTIDNETFTANPSGLFISRTQVEKNGEVVTVDGKAIFLGDENLVIGSSTVPLAEVMGLGPAISSAVEGGLTGGMPRPPPPSETGRDDDEDAGSCVRVGRWWFWGVGAVVGWLWAWG